MTQRNCLPFLVCICALSLLGAAGCSSQNGSDTKKLSQEDKTKLFGDTSKMPSDYYQKDQAAARQRMMDDQARMQTAQQNQANPQPGGRTQ
jgi:hypothetical protein